MKSPEQELGPQSGQILIITAVALFVLLGIAAIVVDLGFSWMLHRQEQNAADPAALAAARFVGDHDPVTGAQPFDAASARAAACHYAIENGVFDESNSGCDSAVDPDAATLTVQYPPDGSAPAFVGLQGHVQVIITKQHDTFFSRIFGMSKATVSAQAVAARTDGPTNTNSLIALKPTGCSTGEIQGNALVHIYPAPGYTGPGGFVQVNSSCGVPTSDDDCGPGGGTGALDIQGTADLYATKVSVHGSCKGSADEPHGALDEAASQVADPLYGLTFPPVDPTSPPPGARCGSGGSSPQTMPSGNASKGCGGHTSVDWDSAPCIDDPLTTEDESDVDCVTLLPGVYYGGWTIANDLSVTLQPGIYVIAGGGVRFIGTSFLDSLDGTGAPAPVLIYNTDNPTQTCPSGQHHHCQDDLNLKADRLEIAGLRKDQPCPPITTSGGCPYGGLVIWDDPNGDLGLTASGSVHVEGNAELYISGTIYAPRSNVSILGTSSENTFAHMCDPTATHVAAVQIISWTWKIGGTGDLCMPYNPAELYEIPRRGLVH